MTATKRALVRFPLRAKLLAGFAAVTVTGGLTAGLLVDRNVQQTTRAAFEDRLGCEATMLGQMTASALFGDLDPADTSLHGPVHALGESVHTQLAVITRDGAVVADSSLEDPRGEPSQADRPEIVAARAAGEGAAVHEGRLYVARAIVRDGAILGYARSSTPMSDVERYVVGVRERIAWGSAFALAAAMGLGFLLSSRVVRPVKLLSAGARRVGAGDFAHPIDVPSRDEIGELAGCFNEMTANLHRTMQVLDGRNRDMRLVLDHVHQGLLTLDRSGLVSGERSAAFDRWFGDVPTGARFSDLLGRFDSKAACAFELQWDQLLEDVLPLELNIAQLPRQVTRDALELELSYTPLFDDGKQLSGVLVVATDETARRAAERAEAEQRELASVLERVSQDRAGVAQFMAEARQQVAALTGDARAPLAETRRTLHTLKGNAALYGMRRLSALCHDLETRMADSEGDLDPAGREALAGAWAGLSTRIAALVGDAGPGIVIDEAEHRAVLLALLGGTPRRVLAGMLRGWTMERASERLERLGAGARELASRLHKGEVRVEVSPGPLRLPRETWAPFWAALNHVVRNAVDHGLEAPSERKARGKPSPPTICLRAEHVEDEIVVEVADDGPGVDWERVAARAREVGLPTGGPGDLVAALFADGLSTRTEVTDVSGRGVGLGAARQECERLGGRVEVESQPDRGTTVRFRFPWHERTEAPRAAREPVTPAGPSSPARTSGAAEAYALRDAPVTVSPSAALASSPATRRSRAGLAAVTRTTR